MRFFLALILFPFFSSCSGLFYYPTHDYYYSPKRLGFSGQEISFPSRDGTKLYAWYFPVQKGKPKGTIVQFHGNAQNMTSHYLSLVWLVNQGYELLTFDYRGYGKSEGKPSQKGTYQDGLTALEKAWELHQRSGAKRFIVYGQSLGGAIAARSLADFPHRSQVDLLVMDSTFASYRSVAHRKLASYWLTWAVSPLAYVLVSDEYSAEKTLREGKTRLLVIHDIRDPSVPYPEALKFFDTAPGPKEFWTLDQGSHVGVFSDPESPYRKKFVSLLDSLAPTSKIRSSLFEAAASQEARKRVKRSNGP